MTTIMWLSLEFNRVWYIFSEFRRLSSLREYMYTRSKRSDYFYDCFVLYLRSLRDTYQEWINQTFLSVYTPVEVF